MKTNEYSTPTLSQKKKCPLNCSHHFDWNHDWYKEKSFVHIEFHCLFPSGAFSLNYPFSSVWLVSNRHEVEWSKIKRHKQDINTDVENLIKISQVAADTAILPQVQPPITDN